MPIVVYSPWCIFGVFDIFFCMRGNFIYKRLGERIVTAREAQKITQDKLSQLAKIDRTYLARIEAGRANPSMRILYMIAKILKLKMCDLLEGV